MAEQLIGSECHAAVAEAERLDDAGDHDAAIEQWTRAITVCPEAALLYFRRGELHWVRDQDNEAERDARRAIELDPDDGQGHRLLGDILMETFRFTEAVEAYRETIRCRRQARDWFEYAGALTMTGAREAAMTALATAVVTDPAVLDSLDGRTGSYLNPVRGEAQFRQITQEFSNAVQEAKRLEESGERARAVDQWTLVSDLCPHDWYPCYEVGLRHWQMGENDEAESDARRAIELGARTQGGGDLAFGLLGRALMDRYAYDDAAAAFETSLELNPHDPAYSIWLACAEAQRGRLDSALDSLERALAIHPERTRKSATDQRGWVSKWLFPLREHSRFVQIVGEETLPKSSSARDLEEAIAEGNRFEQAQEWTSAIQAWTRAIELDPQIAEPYRGRGAALWFLDQNEDAIRDLHQAVALDPNLTVAYRYLGEALMDMDRSVDAAISFEHATRGRRNATDWARLAGAYAQSGERAAALDALAVAIIEGADVGDDINSGRVRKWIVPIRDESRFYDLTTQLADSCSEANRLHDSDEVTDRRAARAAWTRVIDLHSGFWLPFYKRGLSHWRDGQNAEGEADARSAVERGAAEMPQGDLVFGLLGRCLIDQYRYDEAIAAFQKAIGLDPQDPAYWIWLACPQAQRGNVDAALDMLEQAATINPAQTLDWLTNSSGWVYQWLLPLREQPRFVNLVSGKRLTSAPAAETPSPLIDADALNEEGQRHWREADYEQAAVVLQRAVAANPSLMTAQYFLADSLMELERWPEAETAYRAAIDTAGDSPVAAAHFGLAGVLAQRGYGEEALEELAKAIELDSEMRDWARDMQGLGRWLGPVRNERQFLQLVGT